MSQARMNASGIAVMATLLLALSACGGGTESTPGASGAGPDTSGLAEIILGKINQDPTRMDLKVTGKLVEFNVTSAVTEVYEGMGAATVVECAGAVVFDGDVPWNWQEMEPKKAGDQARFECRVEYANQGNGWQVFGPMGIYPL